MPDLSLAATNELSCPNCGAPYIVPAFGNLATCEYCGTRFVVPASVRAENTDTFGAPTIDINLAQPQTDLARWVKWLVIFVVVVTVVPTLCGVAAAVCGALAPLGVFFFR
jgi:DNA-directed RNA polymerase subunit RPC12/RpoP